MQDVGIGWWLRIARLSSSFAFVSLALALVQSLQANQSMPEAVMISYVGPALLAG